MSHLPKHLESDKQQAMQPLNAPYLVAVWPGMGQVAMAAGYYLLSKLNMEALAEFRPTDLFEVEQIRIKDGLVRTGRLPRSRLFVRRDPNEQHDIVLFIGEAQPPLGKWAFCHRLLDFTEQLGVERIFTFAAMATEMEPTKHSRVFGVATDEPGVEELRQLEVQIMDDGMIAGLNGVLLAAGAERGLRGLSLLGEMPFYAPQVPFPNASVAVLEAFTTLAGIELNLDELREHGQVMQEAIDKALDQFRKHQQEAAGDYESEDFTPVDLGLEEPTGSTLSDEDRQHIETLFKQAAEDRSRAYDLKKELDRLGVFDDYEDRFLDLFKPSEE